MDCPKLIVRSLQIEMLSIVIFRLRRLNAIFGLYPVWILKNKGSNFVDSKLLTINEVQMRLNCSRSTIYRWVSEGHFPGPIKLQGMSRWDEREVSIFLKNAKLRRTHSGIKPVGLRSPGRQVGVFNKIIKKPKR